MPTLNERSPARSPVSGLPPNGTEPSLRRAAAAAARYIFGSRSRSLAACLETRTSAGPRVSSDAQPLQHIFERANATSLDVAEAASDGRHRLAIVEDLEGLLPAFELVGRHHDRGGLALPRDGHVLVDGRHLIHDLRQVLARLGQG